MRSESALEKLRFPIGEFEVPKQVSTSDIEKWIGDIALFPSRLVDLVDNLSEEQLSKTYRPEGWTIRQVVHHCADSHLNSFIRFKLAMTEDTPTIRPYLEDKWAEQVDYTIPIVNSIKIIEGLHARWTVLLKSFDATDLERKFVHPEHGTSFSLAEAIAMYAWHCNHHLAHVRLALGK